MIEQANVFIKNKFVECSPKDIQVTLKRADGSDESQTTIASGQTGNPILLKNLMVSLVIKAPDALEEIKRADIQVWSGADMSVVSSSAGEKWKWTLKLLPNDLPPEVPTTVNVTVGDGENP
ncbi:MAG: hypothetical protein KAW12_05605 [Candidatus Aminicenantes bacterium]|nr:hypothetical protein [Candidatus Aminicenantes bacterium]